MSQLTFSQRFALSWHFSFYPAGLPYTEILERYKHSSSMGYADAFTLQNRVNKDIDPIELVSQIITMANQLSYQRVVDAENRSWYVAIDFFFSDYENPDVLIEAVKNQEDMPNWAFIWEPFELTPWYVLCDHVASLAKVVEEAILKAEAESHYLERTDFMSWYRSESMTDLLTPSDRGEIFSSVLLGGSDISKELLDGLLMDYEVSHLVVTECPVPQIVPTLMAQ